jgi:folate-binding protein YgfZ
MYAPLADRALATVEGPDAEKFLQGIVTCDVAGVAAGEARFGGLLSPQGKILFDFFLVRTKRGFLCDVATAARDDFVRRLGLYKLRAAVAIGAEVPDLAVYASWNGGVDQCDGIAVADPRLPALGQRLYCRGKPQGEAGDYDAHRIALGMPEGGKDFRFGECFPHEALMDVNGGISFAKGCYVGQEVVSRVRHRATARSRFVMVAADGPLPAPGVEILAQGAPAGRMGGSAGNRGLALLRLDRAAAAAKAGVGLVAGTLAIRAEIPAWAGFSWIDAEA